MALQTVNLGTYANDGTGDDLRTAFEKVNSNLSELFGSLYGANVGATPPTSGVEEGELWWNTVDGRLYIRYGSVWVEASPREIPPASINNLVEDTSPELGGNLNLNGFNIQGTGSIIGELTGNASTASAWVTPRTLTLAGDVTGSATVDGSQNITLNATVVGGTGGGTIELGGDLDFGTFTEPLEFALDAGTF
jgi:hypothetical protein